MASLLRSDSRHSKARKPGDSLTKVYFGEIFDSLSKIAVAYVLSSQVGNVALEKVYVLWHLLSTFAVG
jgi:hypothetical protein